MSFMNSRLRLIAMSLSAVLVLAACGGGEDAAEETAPPADDTTEEVTEAPVDDVTDGATEDEVSTDDAPEGGEVAASDLRVILNNQLAEHTFFAGAAIVEALQGNEAGFEAGAAALDENSVALSESVGLVYGAEAGDAFLGLWRSHIGMFVDYTQGVAAGDEAQQAGAVEDLTGYANDFAVFLNGANPDLPVATVEQLVLEHVITTKDTVDAFAAGEMDAFEMFRTAMGHMSNIADPLSGAIVAQFPDRFPGDPAAPAADVQQILNLQLQEHTYLAGAAINQALKGNTEAFEQGAGALDGNSVDLAATVGSVYGPEAEEAFLGLWRSHIGMFVDYTMATAAGDDAAKQAALDDLTGYANDFAVFLNGANDLLPVDAVEGLVLTHVDTTRAAIDSLASGEGNPFIELRKAGGHMSMIANPLAGAIAEQQGL